MTSTPTVTAAELRRRLGRSKTEAQIQREILAYLASVPGVYAWKGGSGLLPLRDGRRVRMGKVGVSDIIGWVARCYSRGCFSTNCREPRHQLPRFLAIEVKRPGQGPTVEQRAFLDRVQAAGGLALVATSVDDVRGMVG